ncbi:MAG: glutamate racemase [Bacteroidales bacterium]
MIKLSKEAGPIGIFDSGYGGLTVFEYIRKELPEYDYIYLGDNARAPYGNRSFEIVYEFTLQAVIKLFEMGCQLVILACNTASAKALRSIQQNNLMELDPDRRVLGIIRPTVEVLNQLTQTKHIGILGTAGTIQSQTYELEIHKLSPELHVTGQACPMWVPLVENNEYLNEGADFFVKKYIDEILAKDPQIDTLVLGCTHYPLLYKKIRQYAPEQIQVIPQGAYVAKSLKDYLQRHPEMEERCKKNGMSTFYTTESSEKFAEIGSVFLNESIQVKQITIP